MHPFAIYLAQRLANGLPGFEAQRRMAPRFEQGKLRSFASPPDSRHSAVLALLTQADDTLSVLLTLRSNDLATHKGQLSFPGGKMEEGESYTEAALRETFEEVGIAPTHVHILGELSELYTPPSNSTIHPVVGWCGQLPPLSLSAREVQESLLVPVPYLHDENNIIEEEWDYRGTRMTVPFWRVHPTTPLWGATAVMLSELVALYDEWMLGAS